MINYRVVRNDDLIHEIHVSGHALYDHSGKDIVCASVSTAILVTMNAIEVLKQNQLLDFEIKDGYFRLKVIQTNEIVEGLLYNLIYTLNELDKQYPKYIKNQEER